MEVVKQCLLQEELGHQRLIGVEVGGSYSGAAGGTAGTSYSGGTGGASVGGHVYASGPDANGGRGRILWKS